MPRVALLAVLPCILAAVPPNPVYDATAYRSQVRQVQNGVLYQVAAPSNLPFLELHVFGSAFDRGYAQGVLLSDLILEMVNVQLPDYYREMADELPLGKLPEWLQKIVRAEAEKDAPGAINTALEWVHTQQEAYINASQANVTAEIAGIAQGTCFNKSKSVCDPVALNKVLTNVNSLPELIKMQCSMLGAWGKATPDGRGAQLRTLDFGDGPFANITMLIVHHPDQGFAFALVSFPGFAGAVTGFSERVGLSEKVDDVTGGSNPPGSYDGKPVNLVIREIIQFATSKETAVAMAQKAQRTWGVWLGFGDVSAGNFFAILYDRLEVIPYDDNTLPFATSQPYYNGVAYIDKHPQPSKNPDLPQLIGQYYGNLTALNIVQNIPRLTTSGDVHIAVYDFGARQVYIASGITNDKGAFIRHAYESPFLRWDMDALWKTSP